MRCQAFLFDIGGRRLGILLVLYSSLERFSFQLKKSKPKKKQCKQSCDWSVVFIYIYIYTTYLMKYVLLNLNLLSGVTFNILG